MNRHMSVSYAETPVPNPNIQVRGNDSTGRTYCRFHLQSPTRLVVTPDSRKDILVSCNSSFISSYPNHPSQSFRRINAPCHPYGPARSAGIRLSRAHTTRAVETRIEDATSGEYNSGCNRVHTA